MRNDSIDRLDVESLKSLHVLVTKRKDVMMHESLSLEEESNNS